MEGCALAAQPSEAAERLAADRLAQFRDVAVGGRLAREELPPFGAERAGRRLPAPAGQHQRPSLVAGSTGRIRGLLGRIAARLGWRAENAAEVPTGAQSSELQANGLQPPAGGTSKPAPAESQRRGRVIDFGWRLLDSREALKAFDEKEVGIAATFQTIPKGTLKRAGPSTATRGAKGQIAIGYDFEMQTTPMTWEQSLSIVDGKEVEWRIPREAHDEGPRKGHPFGNLRILRGIWLERDYPVVHISWHEAEYLIHHLNSIQSDYTYRLPSEAEWRYAALAGARRLLMLVEKIKAVLKIGRYRFWARSFPVGVMRLNKFGLRDMGDNVGELMQDTCDEDCSHEVPTDGSAYWDPMHHLRIVLRIFHWGSGEPARFEHPAIATGDYTGLRLVRSRR